MEEIRPADPLKPKSQIAGDAESPAVPAPVASTGGSTDAAPAASSLPAAVPPLLERIDSPADLRRLSPEQLPQVCRELRDFLINSLSDNPGHFASSMGAVEIIVAMHYVFDTPRDRIVFDVGHQAYAHKLLTGRRDAFKTQRTLGGLSGFPNPMESDYDTFVAGHASNSISAALGMAIADKLTPGRQKRKTVALIGDASISGGLAFEGLNNVANNPNDLLIILNDNEMSIDSNVGALHRYLSDLSTSLRYNRARKKIYDWFRGRGYIGDRGKGLILRFNNAVKSLVSKQQNIFEGLNIRYFGPFDGHDVQKIVKVLGEIKDMTGPRILHLHTVKGKGYAPAETNPSIWHAPGKFDPATGERISKPDSSGREKWQDVFGKYLTSLAAEDENIVGITAAMPSGTSMGMMLKKFPERTFDVGISEGHAVTFAGGLAAAGKHPFVAIYSSFLQRAYDNIIHDVAIQGLPVTFCIDRAGLVGEDGVTHHGLMDMAYLRCIPNMTVAAPLDAPTLRSLILTASRHSAPFAIRYPRGNAPAELSPTAPEALEIGKSRVISTSPGAKAAILSIGEIGNEAIEAVKILAGKGIAADHYDMIWLKPLDTAALTEIAAKYDAVVTVEDGVATGGFGSAVGEWLDARKASRPGAPIPTLTTLGVPDKWISQGKVSELREIAGINAAAIAGAVEKSLNVNK